MHAYEHPNTMEFLNSVVMARGSNQRKSFNSSYISFQLNIKT